MNSGVLPRKNRVLPIKTTRAECECDAKRALENVVRSLRVHIGCTTSNDRRFDGKEFGTKTVKTTISRIMYTKCILLLLLLLCDVSIILRPRSDGDINSGRHTIKMRGRRACTRCAHARHQSRAVLINIYDVSASRVRPRRRGSAVRFGAATGAKKARGRPRRDRIHSGRDQGRPEPFEVCEGVRVWCRLKKLNLYTM